MTFMCAVIHEGGVRCLDPRPGDATYLNFIALCLTHQTVFEDVVMAGTLRYEIEAARYRRSDIFKFHNRINEDFLKRPDIPRSKPRDRKPDQVYFLQGDGFIKIGYSENPQYRLKQIRSNDGTQYPAGMDYAGVTIIRTIPGGRPLERKLHAKFAHLRHTGEWFTEAPELTDYIKGLAA